MANMFKPVKAQSVTEYINMLEPERKKAIIALHKLIQQVSPKLRPHFAYNMLGYGKFKYKNYKHEIVDWPIVALASQKNYMSLYVCALDKGRHLAEKHEKQLGKVNVGKSCIRFKTLDDLNLPEVKKVLKKAAASPGLV